MRTKKTTGGPFFCALSGTKPYKLRKIHDSKSDRFECRIDTEILEGA